MKQREWVLTVTITGPDEESVTANFGYNSIDKLTGFPDLTGSSIIRKLAKMLIESTTPEAPLAELGIEVKE